MRIFGDVVHGRRAFTLAPGRMARRYPPADCFEGMTLESLQGLSEARSLCPVTPVDVQLWANPVTADKLFDALQPMRSQRHSWGADLYNLC